MRKIQIVSEIMTSKKLFETLTQNSEFIEYELKELPKGSRPIDPAIVTAMINSLGIGAIVVALINCVKDYKMKELELKANSIEKEKDRQLEKQKLEHQTNMEILKWKIEIVGNRMDSLLKTGKGDEAKKLASKGIEFLENEIHIPVTLDAKTIEEIDDVLDLNSVKQIVQKSN